MKKKFSTSNVIDDNMKSKTLFIEKSIEIDAPAGKVWRALTHPDSSREWIRTWWPEFDVLESTWQPGAPVLWRLCNGTIGGEGLVVIAEPYWELAYNFKALDSSFDKQEVLQFRLREINDTTLLAVSIGDFADSPDHEACYSGAVDGWNKALPKLKTIAESRTAVSQP